MQNTADTGLMCFKCGDGKRTRTDCSERVWTLKLVQCRHRRTTLFGTGIEDISVVGNMQVKVVSFKTWHTNSSVKILYYLPVSIGASTNMSCLLTCRRRTMDMKFVQDGCSSFIQLNVSLPLVLQAKNTKFSFLWSNSELQMSSWNHLSRLLEQTAGIRNV